MSLLKPFMGRFSVEKQESLLKLVILSVAAILCKLMDAIHITMYRNCKRILIFDSSFFYSLVFRATVRKHDPRV
jgi:hypothetical protein